MNKEQYELLKKSVKEFNEYRDENQDVKIDLERADLSCSHLYNLNLRGANLRGANLKYTDLRGADLEGANLEYTNIDYAFFKAANLKKVNIDCFSVFGARFIDVDLKWAMIKSNFTEVIIKDCNLEGVIFKDTDLRGLKLCEDKYYIDLNPEKWTSLKGAIFNKTIMPDGTIRNN